MPKASRVKFGGPAGHYGAVASLTDRLVAMQLTVVQIERVRPAGLLSKSALPMPRGKWQAVSSRD